MPPYPSVKESLLDEVEDSSSVGNSYHETYRLVLKEHKAMQTGSQVAMEFEKTASPIIWPCTIPSDFETMDDLLAGKIVQDRVAAATADVHALSLR